MGDRSTNSGVRNIRAMFEAKAEATSPPSRGRSPTGSERSSSSRPISKVRASFVAVERSGQIGLVRKLSDSAESVGGAPELSRNGSISSEVQLRGGSGGNGPGNVDGTSHGLPLENVKEEESTINESKPESSAKEVKSKTANSLPNGSGKENVKTSATKSGTGQDKQPSKGTEASTENLGNVLKGSPFEPLPVAGEKVESKTPEKKVTENVAKAPKAGPKTAGDLNVGTKGTSTDTKPAVSRPAVISTKAPTVGGSKASAGSQSGKPVKSPKAPQTPTTPKGNTTGKTESAKTTVAKVSTPKANQSKNDPKVLPKEPLKVPVGKPSRPSIAAQNLSESKPKPSPSSNTPTSSTHKKTTPLAPKSQSQSHSPASAPTSQVKKPAQSSSSPFHKPPPKSPTKPVRLPASATAPTTSSAAKTGSAPVSHTNTTTRTNRSLSSKPSRPSLGPAPISHDRPVSRTSSRAPDEGFLARMMRPTASSASKTHEKLEVKTPPRKLASKPKRKSEGTENGTVQEEEPLPGENHASKENGTARDQNEDLGVLRDASTKEFVGDSRTQEASEGIFAKGEETSGQSEGSVGAQGSA